MSEGYKLKKYGNGLDLITVTDEKFKSFAVSIKMILPFEIKKAALYSLALDVCASCMRRYPERDDLSRALTELYSAGISSTEGTIGDCVTLTLTLNCLCDSYTIGKEKISSKAVDMLLDCLYDPLLKDGKLSEKYLEQCRADMLDDIDSVINNKRRYAAVLAKRSIFSGEAAQYSKLDQRETVASCTIEDITKAYYDMIRHSKYLVSVVGGAVEQELIDRIIDRIQGCGREPVESGRFIVPSPLKAEVLHAEEQAEVNQCKLLMAYKTESYNEYASKLMCAMLGVSTFSKLFVNVREKLSLCYYCDSMLTDMRSTMIINSGLDAKNLQLAQEQIDLQLKAIADGDFTDEELENTKLFLSGLYLSNLDAKSDLRAWYLFQYISGTSDSPKEKSKKLYALTREDIMREAAAYKLDTVFVLRPQEGGGSND